MGTKVDPGMGVETKSGKERIHGGMQQQWSRIWGPQEREEASIQEINWWHPNDGGEGCVAGSTKKRLENRSNK